MSILMRVMFFCLLLTSSIALSEESVSKTNFPIGEIFTPIMADAKEPQFSVGIRHAHTNGPIKDFTAAIVSYGEHFGLRRWKITKHKLWQISLGGAVHAQFNLDSSSNDLINADYTIGLVGTHRNGPLSWRFRVLHQSTHLGDEFLLSQKQVERVNFSLEAVDLVASYEWPEWRLLGGGIYVLHVEPREVNNIGFQLGSEYHSIDKVILNGRFVSGVDFQFLDAESNDRNINFKTGLEYGKRGSGNRRVRVMLTAYHGTVPFGQFFNVKTTAVGFSVYLGF